MVITAKIGNLATTDAGDKFIDRVYLEWHECNKRILHKKTESGEALVFKFLQGAPDFSQDDIVAIMPEKLVVIDIVRAEAIVIRPTSMGEMAAICYETGNKHLPLFYHQEELMMPFDLPFFRQLQAMGHAVHKEERQLVHPLKTTVAPHGSSSDSLFSKIMKMGFSNE